jgi:N-acetyl-anhydromuramyl-L-alanine amidase AmpD
MSFGSGAKFPGVSTTRRLLLASLLLLVFGVAETSSVDVLDIAGVFGWPTCRPQGVLIHHTATPDVVGSRPVDVTFLDALHAARGFGTLFRGRKYRVGYHYLVLEDGTIQTGRPEQCQGAHAGTREDNRRYVGIALVGHFDSETNPTGRLGRTEPTAHQLHSLRRLLIDVCARYGLAPTTVLPHGRIRPGTRCPGDRLHLEHVLSDLGGVERARPDAAHRAIRVQ